MTHLSTTAWPRKHMAARSLIGICALFLFCAMGHEASAADVVVAAADPMLKLADFRDIRLIDALNMLSEQTGINMVASTESSKTPVSMTLRNVSVKVAVETLCKTNNLWFKDDNGILRVMTTQEYQRSLTTFREEKTEVFTLMYPNAVSAAVAVRDLYGDRVQLTLGTEERSDTSDDLNDRFDRFDIIDQRSQGLGLFEGGGTSTSGGGRGGSSGGGSRSGGSSSSGGFTQRSTIQRDANQARRNSETAALRGDLRNLSSDELQALKQAQLSGNQESVEQILNQYRNRQSDIYIAISRRNNLIAVRTSDQHALEEVGKLIRRLDVPTSVVLLEVKVMSIELDKDLNSAFDFQFTDGVKTVGGFNSGDILPPGADSIGGALRRASPLSLGGTGLQSGNLAFQYVDRNFRVRMQALQNKNKVTTLATPMLMTANNEVSRLFVGEERPIIRNISSQTVTNNNTTTSSPNTTIEFRPVGTTLLITPNINADRTVTLRILQENSAIKHNDATIPVVTNDGGLQQQPVDVVTSRSVSGTVVSQDGMTLAIGGLIEENISDMKAQIPLLGDIPGVGVIFRRQSKSKTRSELVILIRPRILTTPSEGEAASKELLEQLSIHPKAQNPRGTLNLFGPKDVLPQEKCKDFIPEPK